LRFDTIIQIVNPDEEEDVLAAAVVVGLGLSLAGMALMLVLGEWLFANIVEYQVWHAGYALVVPLLALMNGLLALSWQYFAKKTRYRRLSLSNFLRTLGMVASQLLFVFVLPGPAGLIAGFGAGLLLALVLAWPLPPTILNRLATAPVQALHTARATIQRHRAYIRVDVVNALLATSVRSLYPIIVLIGFGVEEAGIFAVASRLVFIPISVLAAAISTVYFQRLSLAVRRRRQSRCLFWLPQTPSCACCFRPNGRPWHIR
jgi:MFS family permease